MPFARDRSTPGGMDLVARAETMISAGSKSFRFASRLFDRATRERSWLLYAWCRACDDLADGQTLGHDAVAPIDPAAGIARIRDLTDRALAGEETGEGPFDALGLVAAECAIPRRYIEDHIEGFALDAAGWRPRTEDDLLRYCYHVAGAVGCMMAVVMGVDPADEETLDRAADLGLAFQLANIARDPVEDARVGRVYLPTDWLEEAGLTEAEIASGQAGDKLAPLARRLSQLARQYRESARIGARRLPFRSRWAVLAAGRIYGGIAETVEALGARAWDQRVSTSKREKFGHVAGAWVEATREGPAEFSRAGLWTRGVAQGLAGAAS